VSLALAVPLALAGLWWWGTERARMHREAVDACPGHEWEYVSLYDMGRPREWVRRCGLCPEQGPVLDEELAMRLTREHRAAKRGND
jgi:hypothetical protein